MSNENDMIETTLEQSMELNRIQGDMLKERQKSSRAPWIVCAVVAICFTVALCSTFLFFSQYEFAYEEVVMDTNEGSGNNNYFAQDGNTYNESSGSGGVTSGENDS